jgi:DNA-binding HxlR family transcriptional regulator
MNHHNTIESKDGCIAKAMDIIANKWTALIIRDLANQPKRYCQLEKSVMGINPRILSKRLFFLEQEGIIDKIILPSNTIHAYQLTTKGRDLLPILYKMSDWGNKYTC